MVGVIETPIPRQQIMQNLSNHHLFVRAQTATEELGGSGGSDGSDDDNNIVPYYNTLVKIFLWKSFTMQRRKAMMIRANGNDTHVDKQIFTVWKDTLHQMPRHLFQEYCQIGRDESWLWFKKYWESRVNEATPQTLLPL
jgi:hypothetical protein